MDKPIAPTSQIGDGPVYCFLVNEAWATIIIGLLSPALEVDFWGGDSEDITNGIQGIETFLDGFIEICP